MKTFQSLEQVLAKRESVTRVFFRNDDGGWADQELKRLVENFTKQDLPLDIAVIPGALKEESASMITSMVEGKKSKVRVHQHGFRHTNHQAAGRACEFGSDRNLDQQYSDIAEGQKQMTAAFGDKVDPIFTPPWNRCTADTVAALGSLGFQSYSRITGSEHINTDLPELPVAFDWLKKRKGVRLNTEAIADYACNVFESDVKEIGVMLHHQHMSAENIDLLNQMIDVLRRAPDVSFHSMIDVARLQQDQRC